MPAFPSGAFLLWHEAASPGGSWARLLRQRATADVALALWLLQTYLLRPREAREMQEAEQERAKAIIASGWGR